MRIFGTIRIIRFIPACAGNIGMGRSFFSGMAVHPRVCGEHCAWSPWFRPCRGSSPRVRGTFASASVLSRLRRFIPACAGNIAATIGRMTILTVHPRVCGEHNYLKSDPSGPPGSSPRVRGTFDCPRRVGRVTRFIPACAGNIDSGRFRSIRGTVHPRVCGEHVDRCHEAGQRAGSSPRVRGTLRLSLACPMWLRFIPACAGNMRVSK